MKERPASEVEAACDAAFAPLCWARLRYSGAGTFVFPGTGSHPSTSARRITVMPPRPRGRFRLFGAWGESRGHGTEWRWRCSASENRVDRNA